MPERLATFRGEVQCERAHCVPQLTLSGMTLETPEPTALAFSASAPGDLPGRLRDVVVEHVGGTEYRISAPGGSWQINASAVHLHREVAAQFHAAIPPRQAPWAKRLFWGAVLALARTRAGIALLKALRG